MDMKTGRIRWVRQMTDLDVWNGGCREGDPVVCSEDAPDYDFGASPILVETKDGKRVLVAGNKSAIIYALDPDHDGKTIWQQKIGRGGTSGGVLWGPATDSRNIFAATGDGVRVGGGREVDPNMGGGITAVDVSTGEKVWSTPHPPCGNRKPCSPTQAAAVSATAGVVFSGSNDGRIRAYSTQDGKILWEHPTRSLAVMFEVMKNGNVMYAFGGRYAFGCPGGIVTLTNRSPSKPELPTVNLLPSGTLT